MFVPWVDGIDLRAEFTSVAHERYKDGEPNFFLTEIRGTLLLEDDHGNGTPIGSMTGHYIDIANGTIECRENSIFDLFDCRSEEFVDAYNALFNAADSEEFWEEFEDNIALGFNVLVIDEVKLDREDHNLAIRFLKLIVDTEAHGANFVVAFNFTGLSEQTLGALEFFPSPRVPGVFILNRAAPFQGAVAKALDAVSSSE